MFNYFYTCYMAQTGDSKLPLKSAGPNNTHTLAICLSSIGALIIVCVLVTICLCRRKDHSKYDVELRWKSKSDLDQVEAHF